MEIDEKKINKNIEELRVYFDDILKKYFDNNGFPILKYFENTVCYNCGSDEISSEFIVNRFTHVRCKECGMVYVNPRFKESVAHDLYNEKDYSEFYKIKLIPNIDYRKNVIGVNKYKQIMSHFDKPGKVLDIGCGLGEVLSVFKENRWDTLGIEFNKFAADYCRREFGIEVVNKSIYDFDSSQKFDLIILWGVLEHFVNPKDVLKKAYELLSDNGLLVIEVPSADSVLVRYYERTMRDVDRIIEGDRHLMLFSVRGFKNMTRKCGFSVVDLLSNGLDIATLNRLELGNTLELQQVNELQKLLDDSIQGDLLRGFFRKI